MTAPKISVAAATAAQGGVWQIISSTLSIQMPGEAAQGYQNDARASARLPKQLLLKPTGFEIRRMQGQHLGISSLPSKKRPLVSNIIQPIPTLYK